jgi:hypothetical protein
MGLFRVRREDLLRHKDKVIRLVNRPANDHEAALSLLRPTIEQLSSAKSLLPQLEKQLQAHKGNRAFKLLQDVSLWRRWAVGGLFGLIAMPVGAFIIYAGYDHLKHAEATHSWPSTQGKVVISRVIKKTSYSSERRRRGYNSRTTTYNPKIRYQYQVGGRSYKSNQISYLTNDYSGWKRANDLVKQYPKGRKVTVYYDPAKPSESVLKRGGSSSAIVPFAIGAGLGIPGLVIFLIFLVIRSRTVGVVKRQRGVG